MEPGLAKEKFYFAMFIDVYEEVLALQVVVNEANVALRITADSNVVVYRHIDDTIRTVGVHHHQSTIAQ